MTDILDLDGWKAIETRLDGAEYEIEAEYLKQPDACPKCGVIWFVDVSGMLTNFFHKSCWRL